MASGFEKFVMGAGLAASAAFTPETAYGRETEAQIEERAMHAQAEAIDGALELAEDLEGYEFKVETYHYDNVFKKGPGDTIILYQFQPHGESLWHRGTELHAPRGLNQEDLNTWAVEHVADAMESFERTQKEARAIVEDITITGVGAEMIEKLHGNPELRIGKQNGQNIVEIRITDNAHDGYLYLDATTSSVWVGDGRGENGERVLEVRVENEDGSHQTAQWSMAGAFLGVK